MVSFERVFEIIDLPIEIPDRSDALPLTLVRGELCFENVSFRYEIDERAQLSDVRRYGRADLIDTALSGSRTEGDEETGAALSQAREIILEDINFQVQPGELVALVGPSGAGKTTLTYLIPRLYDPTSGIIRIDGHDLREVSLASLSAQIGMVTQETHLFHDTIRTNLIYARLDASQAEIRLPAGPPTFMILSADCRRAMKRWSSDGYRLSGGEKQRIALARVILKDPRILVLDEATSHLDSESEGAHPGGAAAVARAHQHRHRSPSEHHSGCQFDPGNRPRADRRRGA